MPAAIAIPLIIGGATTAAQVYGAKKASGTAKNAGQIQSDAANRAADLQFQGQQDSLNFLREEAAFNRQQQAPYRALGSGAVSTLANLTGIPLQYGQPGPPGGPQAQYGQQGGTLGTVGQPTSGVNRPAIPRPVGFGQTEGTAAQMVLLRAPDGSQRRVPAARAQQFIARGAQVVN